MATGQPWDLDQSDGELRIHTDVAGRAAKMGHRLTIAMNTWRATAWLVGDEPVAADLTVEVDSFRVVRSEGGLKPLAAAEKAVVRSNALRSLAAARFPRIRFHAADIEKTAADSYRIAGTLEIRGAARECVVDVGREDVGDAWRFAGQVEVRQSDFGVRPFSLLAGTLKVVDTVTVAISVTRPKA